MRILPTLTITLSLFFAACTDDPSESQTKQSLSGWFWQNDMQQTFLCDPGSVEGTEMYQPWVSPEGYPYGWNQLPDGTWYYGVAYVESRVTSAWYSFVDYQGNQYCTGDIHNDWYHYQ